MASSDAQGSSYEAEHVHSVYEEIASHFSSTRYKPWPIVERFLKGLPDGAVGLDVGCGNGKYLAVNPKVFIVGSDRSTNLTKIASQHKPHSAIVADNLSLPHPLQTFDFAISIAVIHHLSTPSRRVEAVKSILELLRPPPPSSSSAGNATITSTTATGGQEDVGRALIYVWALEQKDSRRGWDEGHEQDVMVPWVMKGKKEKAPKRNRKGKGEGASEEEESAKIQHAEKTDGAEEGEAGSKDKTFLRYYHLYRKGELEHDIEAAGGKVIEAGYEKDNWWAIAVPR